MRNKEKNMNEVLTNEVVLLHEEEWDNEYSHGYVYYGAIVMVGKDITDFFERRGKYDEIVCDVAYLDVDDEIRCITETYYSVNEYVNLSPNRLYEVNIRNDEFTINRIDRQKYYYFRKLKGNGECC